MNESTPSQVHCSHCQTPLSNDHVGPCPECGKTGKTVSVRMAAGMELAGSISWETRRKYYEKNPWVLAGVIAITVGSSVIGLVMGGPLGVVVGLVLGAISFAIGPWAATRIIEIQRGP